jgi:hypothetical protein
MTDTPAPKGTPPGGGRWDHDTMSDAAEHPIKGPASHDTLAASGGLEVPGGEPQPAEEPEDAAYEPIPGEREKREK